MPEGTDWIKVKNHFHALSKEKRARYNNRIALIFLAGIALAMAFALIACSSPLTLDQARERLEELIPRSQAIEEIVWGRGIDSDGSVVYDPSVQGAQYCKVSPECEIESLTEVIVELANVYSVERAAMIMQIAFIGTEDVSPRYAEEGEDIYVDLSYRGKNIGKNIDLSTLRMVKGNAYSALFEVEYGELSGKNGIMELTLVNTDGVWLLDSPTYYSE